MELRFQQIQNYDIFCQEFKCLNENNGTIDFKKNGNSGGIAVVYAPNGTGKSSFAKILQLDKKTKQCNFLAFDERGNTITPETNAFYVIEDQINRNIIKGNESDYLVGKQIRREFELREKINQAFNVAYKKLVDIYKSKYGVNKVTDYLLVQIEKSDSEVCRNAFGFVRSIVNNKDHGNSIKQEDLINFIVKKENTLFLQKLDENKKKWIIEDLNGEKIADIVINLDCNGISKNHEINQIEKYDDAIGILHKYKDSVQCIVCDNHDFNRDLLLNTKEKKLNNIYESLDAKTKELLQKIIKNDSLTQNDPFGIKQIVKRFVAGGSQVELLSVQKEVHFLIDGIIKEMVEELKHCFDGTNLLNEYDEFVRLTGQTPEFDEEEILYIREIINENIGKSITLERDRESKNFKLKLDDKELLGVDRQKLELSTGEQNFISLTFELLSARHSDNEYIVLDDPISSFDSIYKNRIAYCIIKFLENKKQIVLTHNTDLIRLLDVQLNDCFNLYILNNVENGQNGFIPINKAEKSLLLNLYKLVQFFMNKDGKLKEVIKDERLFLMSMIPFLRGYLHIIRDSNDEYVKLSEIMHGYGNGKHDIVPIYNKYFGNVFSGREEVSVDDVLDIDCNNIDILDANEYPLLADTLKKSLIYYHLRMKVENVLVDLFNIPTEGIVMLNQLIQKAFYYTLNDINYKKKREFKVFFASRKTLLNEFNHFEGNMNIFQPAIDINTVSLFKEIDGIEKKLEELKIFVNGSH